MNVEVIPMKRRLLDAIEQVAAQSDKDDLLEDAMIAALEGPAADIIDEVDDSDDDAPPVLSLSSIPMSDWDSIKLSTVSRFGDAVWDFSEYPHVNKKQVRVNWDFVSQHGVNLTDPRYIHWARIIKALVFYSIPHFAVSNFVRSYGSVRSKTAKMRRVIAFFKEHNLYLNEPGQPGFRTINDLSPDTVIEFLNGQRTPIQRWETAHALQFWQKLSFGKLLPFEYSIHERVVTNDEVSRLRRAYDDQVKPYEPIALDDYASMIHHCMRMVEDYSEDVLWLYDTYYPSVVGGYQYPDRAELRFGGHAPGSEEGVAAFLAYQPVSHDGKPWWPLHVRTRSNESNAKLKPWGFVSRFDILAIIQALMDACVVIILAATGMRVSEVLGLRIGCVSRDVEGYWLRYTVFKTSQASQGDQKRIPIPAVTAQAITIVERLCKEARTYGNTDLLFVGVDSRNFGMPVSGSYFLRAVKRVARTVDADESVHPHRFRKTLAMYLVYQDPKNIEIVRQLFSHVSLKMTLRYVLSLPGINSEIRSIIARQNVDVLLEVLDGALSGHIGGKGGQRLHQSVENSPQLVARLQDKGKESLVQYVETMLDQGIKLLHRTNLAICMKTPGHLETAPCDAKNDDAVTKLHPNLFACDPFNCLFAAFVESSIPALRSEVIFHHKLVRHPYTGTSQKNFSERRINEALKRLAELGETETQSFLKEVVNG